MQISELARLVGRSVDTLKRWEQQGLLVPQRDNIGRRRYDLSDIDRCHELGTLAVEAQRKSIKLSVLAADREHPLLPFSK